MPTTNKNHRSPRGQRAAGCNDSKHAHSEPSMTDSLTTVVTCHRQQLVSWEDVVGRR